MYVYLHDISPNSLSLSLPLSLSFFLLQMYLKSQSWCGRFYRVSILLAILLSAYVLWGTPYHCQCKIAIHVLHCCSQPMYYGALPIIVNVRSLYMYCIGCLLLVLLSRQVTILNGMGVSGRIIGKVCVHVFLLM